jgi:integrase/recombinase XerC
VSGSALFGSRHGTLSTIRGFGEYLVRQGIWTQNPLLYGTGLRRGELERLDIEQFDRAEGLLRIDGGKSGRERCVPVSELVFRCLEAYWPERHNKLERSGGLSERALLVGGDAHF